MPNSLTTFHSSRQRIVAVRTAYAGDTWLQFKRAVESIGVTDHTVIASITFGTGQYGTGHVTTEFENNGVVDIKEVG